MVHLYYQEHICVNYLMKKEIISPIWDSNLVHKNIICENRCNRWFEKKY